MAYTLQQFCADSNAALKAQPLDKAIDAIAGKLTDLLKNEDFVKATFSDDTPAGKRDLYHDPEFDFYVLAHVQDGGKRGTPHSHGTSWAIYGNINGVTEMTEYRRTNPESEEAAILEVTDKYGIGAGQTRGYGPNKIHSTAHPEKCWVIRVTGCDLDHLPRYKFRKFRDQILETAA
ncbi:MAG: hypothetical protein K2Y29_13320 [Beijerinckiaceae bacterium]|nr:hypothetical protein [Beijerinckiaceae bacterium]